jgi:NitT/TauT family transport system ATP-binding protein
MALIEIENVAVQYGSPARPVLEGIDLEIEEGEFVCVLGQTGCGKSTLLRLVLGSERPAAGAIRVDGREHSRPDRTRGYVPQKYSLFPDKTVIENITFGPIASEFGLLGRLLPRYHHRRREVRAEAMGYIRRIGLRDADALKYPDELSGGMQQRVAIAQALMTRPRTLLMDEAFSALDPGTRRGMQRLIRELWEATGTTILFVTHNTQEALALATRIIVLAKDSPDRGSRVALDVRVSRGCAEDETARLVRRLERVAQCEAEEEGFISPAAVPAAKS